MTQSPAFQFYPNDFTGSGKVGTMTTEEVGMYVLLLCLDWNETGFEYDEKRLARWCRVSRAKFRRDWQAVSECFKERAGRLYNPRLEDERIKQAEWREKSRKGGVASAKARSKGGSTVVEPDPQPKGNTPSPTPSTKKDRKTSRHSKSSSVADAPTVGRIETSWVAEAAGWWQETVGTIAEGRMGAALKPLVDRFGWPDVRNALIRWVLERQAEGKDCRVEWFAAQGAQEVKAPEPANPLDGLIPDAGVELRTRPRTA